MNQQSCLSAEELRTLGEDELQTASGGGSELIYRPFIRGIPAIWNVVQPQVANPVVLGGLAGLASKVGF
jgi:hypothetical protein